MVLGLTSEGYVVYYAYSAGTFPCIASINGALLFFTAFSAAKAAAEDFRALFAETHDVPKYVWIQPINKIWIDTSND